MTTLTPTAATATTVPFSALVAADDINARALDKAGLDELAASIDARGLIQPLAVRPSAANADRYEVIDGRRRYAAVAKLVKAKRWAKATPIPVLIRNEDDADALETSLVANTARLPMHPVDQHAVFARLVEQGRSVADIATRFGLAERTVKQQLALGRLAEPIRKAWRDGRITAEAAQAFTLHRGHAVQAAAWDRLKGRAKTESRYGGGLSAYDVRRELADDRPPQSQFSAGVIARYLARGGTLTEDLFDDKAYVDDAPLARAIEGEIAAQRLGAKTAEMKAHGWAWVAVSDDLPREWKWEWERIRTDWQDVTDEEQARIDALQAQIEATDDADEQDRLQAECNAIVEASELASYTPQMRARSGVVIEVPQYDRNTIAVAYGVVRPEETASNPTAGEPADEEEGDEDLPSVSAMVGGEDAHADDNNASTIAMVLLADITRAQTEAAATVVAQDFELALRIAVAALQTVSYGSPAKLQIEMAAHDRPDTTSDFARTWARVRAMRYGDVLTLFAKQVAGSLSLVSHHPREDRKAADALVSSLAGSKYLLWMREAFLADDYFKRIPKGAILAALEEMRGCGADLHLAPEMGDMKKAALAQAAAEAAKACGWLPPELRHPEYALAAADAPTRRLTGKTAAAEQTGEVAP